MLRPTLTAVAILLPALSAGGAEPGDSSVGPRAAVATGSRSATVKVQGDAASGAALEVTVRPLSTDPSTPFLVQVYVDRRSRPHDDAELLGSFSFLPVRVGQAQTFVLPKPVVGGLHAADVTLAIKLVPANPARGLGDAAVEILGARLVDD